MQNSNIAEEKRKKAVDWIWIHIEPIHWNEAIVLLKEAITFGDKEAYYYLGHCYIWKDAGIEKIGSKEEGCQLYYKGAILGSIFCIIGLEEIGKLDQNVIDKCKVSPHKAIATAMDFALNGDPYACYLLGNMYLYGMINNHIHMPVSMKNKEKYNVWRKEAKRWFLQAAKFNVPAAMENISRIYEYEGNNKQAMQYRKMAADADYGTSCYRIALDYLEGGKAVQNIDLAFFYLEKGMTLFHKDCAYKFAVIYYNGQYKVKIDKGKAFLYFEKAFEFGCKASGYFLGQKYHKGFNTHKNILQAIYYYKAAIDYVNGNAALELGRIYYFGQGIVPIDYQMAKKYFEKSIQVGGTIAGYYLGEIYLKGLGVQKDIEKAVEYYKKAADYNNKSAAKRLAKIYFWGKDKIKRNKEKAVYWRNKY